MCRCVPFLRIGPHLLFPCLSPRVILHFHMVVGATVCSNLGVFLVAFFLLSSGGEKITPAFAESFHSLAYAITGLAFT